MNTRFKNLPGGEDHIVYVRPLAVADLPGDVQEAAEGLDQLYGLHDADGRCLAVVRDRELAFVLARQNDLAPVNVH